MLRMRKLMMVTMMLLTTQKLEMQVADNDAANVDNFKMSPKMGIIDNACISLPIVHLQVVAILLI